MVLQSGTNIMSGGAANGDRENGFEDGAAEVEGRR